MEKYRQAFMTRLHFVEFKKEYDGETEFPYDAVDLAIYLKIMLKKE